MSMPCPAIKSMTYGYILGAIAIGVGATLVMDLWNLFLKRTFGIASQWSRTTCFESAELPEFLEWAPQRTIRACLTVVCSCLAATW
jgi:hypothetical protein